MRLLQRTTHTMRLTVDGERCFKRAKELLANWAAFEADLRGAQEEPDGLLRVAVPHAFGQERFVEPLARFLRDYPRVSVEWLLQDDVRDFVGSGIDCAIQVGEPTDPAVVAIRLSKVPRFVVAAPSVLNGADVPADPDALAALPWLALRTYYRTELALTHSATGETRRIAMRPRITTANLYALRSAALLGVGACVGSSWMLADHLARGELVHLAPEWQAAPLPVYLTYPHAQFYPSRLVRFAAMMREAVPGNRRRARQLTSDAGCAASGGRRAAAAASAAPDPFGQRADAAHLGRIEPRARRRAVGEHVGRILAPEQVAVECEGRHAEYAVRDRVVGVCAQRVLHRLGVDGRHAFRKIDRFAQRGEAFRRRHVLPSRQICRKIRRIASGELPIAIARRSGLIGLNGCAGGIRNAMPSLSARYCAWR